MKLIGPDEISRTAKIEIDAGRATSLADADERLSRYVLQVRVGDDIASVTRQACLLTIVSVASRAFLGGVRVSLAHDCEIQFPWARGARLSEAIHTLGGVVTEEFVGSHPTIVIGNATNGADGIAIHATWNGWASGVTDIASDRLAEVKEFTLSGILSAALAVSEAFQHVCGNVVAGRRSVGLSLWRPELEWTGVEAEGRPVRFVPSRIWLLGLGHLGQAFAWSIGALPYPDATMPEIWLQDVDYVVPANWSTSILTTALDVGKRKTRVVDARLAHLGFRTSIIERYFDAEMRRAQDEPGLALGGFDGVAPRRALGGAGFDAVVDAGLGTGSAHYDDLLIHSFPSGLTPKEAWPNAQPLAPQVDLSAPAYVAAKEQMKEAGLSEEQAKCGVVEIAGRTAAAAFVGVAASTLVVAEVLRTIAGGPRYEVIDLSLRSSQHRVVVPNTAAGTNNLPFVVADLASGW